MIMNEDQRQDLITFHAKATKATYAGGMGKTKSQRVGFVELEYEAEPLYYRDSYTGFLRSWGQEIIYCQGIPFWTNLYGGGMEPAFMETSFALDTFGFLKSALSSKNEKIFSPRGPDAFSQNDWCYACSWQGDVADFYGAEFITHKGTTVFRHAFRGGLVIGQE